ncbi:MAG: Rho-binding antiterminator [Pseudomonas sp.]
MDTYQPLNCQLYDYLEIACMHGYQLEIEMVDGSHFSAKALTTRTSPEKSEFLCVEAESGQQEIRLDHLLAITPLDHGAQFGRILLSSTSCQI